MHSLLLMAMVLSLLSETPSRSIAKIGNAASAYRNSYTSSIQRRYSVYKLYHRTEFEA